jgi:tetratricopeptide (TPR) repeat protein
MHDDEFKPTPGAEPSKPLVLIPMMAEDVERRQRKVVLSWIAAALALALVTWFVYQRSMNPLHAQESYDAGVRLIRDTHYEQAILNFDRTIELQPEFADAYRMRGKAYLAETKPDAAIQDFTKLAQMRPSDPEPLVERGFAYLDKKDYASAIADAVRALALNPRMGRAYNLRATALRATGDREKALADFTRAVELEPNLDNYFQRASTYQMLGRHKLAVADFDEAVGFAPDQSHCYFARAQSRAATGDLAGAKQDIEVGRKMEGW